MKKIVKNSVITVLFTIIILTVFPSTVFAAEYEPRLTAPNGEPYYTRELNAYSKTGYGMPNCVAYAYGRVYELNGEAPKISRGNAGEWWFINKNNDYYEYGSEPKLGAVACWSRHVAVVEEISENGDVTVSESHWGSAYFDTKTFSDMYSHYGQTFYGYIYTYDEPEEEEVKVLSYKTEEKDYSPQEKTCFTVLEVHKNTDLFTSPNANPIFNK